MSLCKKLNIYSTHTGQKESKLHDCSKNYPQYARDMEFLTKIRSKLNPRSQDVVNAQILQLKRQLTESKSKRVEVKIKRAMELRD